MGLRNILAPRQQIQTAAGDPLAGGKVFLFEPGTTTFVTSFRDSGLVTPHTNPVRLSGSARANVWVTRDVDMFVVPRTNVSDLIPSNPVISELNANPDSLGADESGGLIANGSFEIDANADLIPDSWVLASEVGATNQIDATESTDGAQSFRFTSSGVGGGSLTTENFFPVNDVDPLRVNIDLRSTVAGVRNIVRVEWYDVSQVAISNSDPYDSTANPAVYTTQNLSVLPPVGARFAKLRLIGVDPSVLLAGSTYFDRCSVFYPAVVTGVFDNITVQDNEIVTTNLNGDLNFRPNGTGATVVDFNGNPVLRSRVDGIEVVSAGDGDQTVPDAVLARTVFQSQNGNRYGFIGYNTGSIMNVQNEAYGARVDISGSDLAGAARNMMTLDPVGNINLFNNAIQRLQISGSGNINLYSDTNTDTESRRLIGNHQDGTDRWMVGNIADGQLRLLNYVHGESVLIQAEDTGGVSRNLITGDPDGEAGLYYAGSLRVGTRTDGAFIRGASVLDPAVGGVQDALVTLNNANGLQAGVLGFAGSALTLNSNTHGNNVQLRGEDTGGTIRNLFIGDPDGSTQLFNGPDGRVLQTTVNGADFYDPSGSAPTLGFRDSVAARLGIIQYTGSNLFVRSEMHGAPVTLQGEDAGGTLRNLVAGDPDADVKLYQAGTEVARTLGAAAGGFEANNTLTGAGFERVLTVSDLSIQLDMLGADAQATTTTLQNIMDAIPLVAGDYLIEVGLLFDSNSSVFAPNAAFRADYSSTFVGTSYGFYKGIDSTGGALQIGTTSLDNTNTSIDVGSSNSPYEFTFGVSVTGAGNLQIQFAVGSGSSGSPEMNVRRGSWVRATRIS